MKRKKVRYVFLEPSAVISDPDFIQFNAAQRGAYWTVILHLYLNKGQLPFDKKLLKEVCKCSNFEKTWNIIEKKFVIKNEIIKHKRVTKELRAAKRKSQMLSEAGVKGNKKRWKDIATQSPPDSHPIANRSEAKRSEQNRREQNRKEANPAIANPVRTETAEDGRLRQAVSNAKRGTGIRGVSAIGNCIKLPRPPSNNSGSGSAFKNSSSASDSEKALGKKDARLKWSMAMQSIFRSQANMASNSQTLANMLEHLRLNYDPLAEELLDAVIAMAKKAKQNPAVRNPLAYFVTLFKKTYGDFTTV